MIMYAPTVLLHTHTLAEDYWLLVDLKKEQESLGWFCV